MTDPTQAPALVLPADAIVVPYQNGCHGVYETPFAAFCHELIGNQRSGPAGKQLVKTCAKRADQGLTFILLSAPLVAWNTDTNATMLARALILLECNQSRRRDVWVGDCPKVLRSIFDTTTVRRG